MLTFADIESRPYQNFINTLKSNFTKETYEFHLRKFMAEFPNLTIESFLELPINEVEEKIVDYILKLKKEGLSSIYIRLKLSTIKHLCVMNDVRINKEKIGKFIGESIRKTNDRAYTHEEIKLIIDTCDLRLKVFILLLASTGMRVGAIPSLKLRHLQRLDSLYMLTVYENTKDQYITFCTPEASACSP